MAGITHTVVGLRLGTLAESDVAVRRVLGREALSEPYSFEIDFQPAEGAVISLSGLGGSEALLTLRRPDGQERHVHGLVWSVELTEVLRGLPRYRVHLAPRLLRLSHVRRSRIFQGLAVPAIVRKVLQEGGIEHRLALSGTYPARDFCMQYREPDLDFVSRLLEDEGISYRFEHTEGAHVLVLADSASGTAPLPGDAKVPYRDWEEAAEEEPDEHLTRLSISQRARATRVALRDFDFERPLLALSSQARAASDTLGLEHYEFPGGFGDAAEGSMVAKRRLEELRFGAETVEGAGTSARFAPGLTFEVEGHPEPGFDRKLLLVRVEHEVTQAQGATEEGTGYRNTFVALDASVPFRPLRRTAWPVACAETATVAGPGGEEIHANHHAGIKVQFHWDREGRRDETSSAWIRVAQSWAGPAWGASLVPRIGQEVLVRFLDGDPDRPIVLGAIYNGKNPPPIALPGAKTQSTLRTDSSPGGGGANELRFEDAAGGEQVLLHAQKDEAVRVLDHKRQRVGRNERLSVSGTRARDVGNDQSLRVHQDDETLIDGLQTIEVKGDRETTVDGGETERVGTVEMVRVLAGQKVTVKQDSALRVRFFAAVRVKGDLQVESHSLETRVAAVALGAVGGDRSREVKGDASETVGGDSTLLTGGDCGAEVDGKAALVTGANLLERTKGKASCEVTGKASLAAKSTRLKTEKLTVTVGGTEFLSVTGSGEIAVSASSITVNGVRVRLKGSEVQHTG